MTLVKTQQTPVAQRNELGLTRWNPWDEFSTLRTRMDDLFNRTFGYTPMPGIFSTGIQNHEPVLDIYTTDDLVTVYCTLPGYTAEDVHVEATADTLTIYGERKSIPNIDKAVAEQSSGQLGESRFRVQCSLPCEVDPRKVKAYFKNGILHTEMPKSETARIKAVKVPVRAE
jgi:HSP20 family protein